MRSHVPCPSCIYIYIEREREHRSSLLRSTGMLFTGTYDIRQLYPPLPVILMILSMYVDLKKSEIDL